MCTLRGSEYWIVNRVARTVATSVWPGDHDEPVPHEGSTIRATVPAALTVNVAEFFAAL